MERFNWKKESLMIGGSGLIFILLLVFGGCQYMRDAAQYLADTGNTYEEVKAEYDAVVEIVNDYCQENKTQKCDELNEDLNSVDEILKVWKQAIELGRSYDETKIIARAELRALLVRYALKKYLE